MTTSAQFGGNSYTFCIPEDITAPVTSTGVAFFTNIKVYEGTFITQTFQQVLETQIKDIFFQMQELMQI